MTPETNHDVEISIYHDFLEDQGIIVDRDPEEQDQWIFDFNCGYVGDGHNDRVGGEWYGQFVGAVGGGGGQNVGIYAGVGWDIIGVGGTMR